MLAPSTDALPFKSGEIVNLEHVYLGLYCNVGDGSDSGPKDAIRYVVYDFGVVMYATVALPLIPACIRGRAYVVATSQGHAQT